MPALLADGLALTSLCLIELYDGVLGNSDPVQARRELRQFLRGVTVLPVNQRVILRTATLRRALRQSKAPIQHRAYDLIGAATALAYGLILVSSNTRDYQDIPGLQHLNPRTGQLVTYRALSQCQQTQRWSATTIVAPGSHPFLMEVGQEAVGQGQGAAQGEAGALVVGVQVRVCRVAVEAHEGTTRIAHQPLGLGQQRRPDARTGGAARHGQLMHVAGVRRAPAPERRVVPLQDEGAGHAAVP